jgi:crotonobetainyl-CoA:carnitine CoA-transferase CaiB-like acyl-CoA transferase
VLGVPELKEDPRFKERDTRKANRYELTPLLEEKLILHETEYWVEKLNERDVPSGAILSLDKALTQPQVEHRNTFKEVEVANIGKIKLFNMTAKFEKTPGLVESPPPLLSQHTKEILSGLGYSETEIKQFKEEGII